MSGGSPCDHRHENCIRDCLHRQMQRTALQAARSRQGREFPRHRRGGTQSLTYRGVHQETSSCEPPSNTRIEKFNGRTKDAKSLEVGVQISCCIYSEVPKEGIVCRVETASGHSVQGACQAQGVRNTGGSCYGRSCAYADRDTAKVCGRANSWLYKRIGGDSHSPEFRRKEEKLRGSTFLGTRILCVNSRNG